MYVEFVVCAHKNRLTLEAPSKPRQESWLAIRNHVVQIIKEVWDLLLYAERDREVAQRKLIL